MLPYERRLKGVARRLRHDMTGAEQTLWRHIRRKQILGVQFYRQKPVSRFVVDFYAPRVRLVVELDGGHHWLPGNQVQDRARDEELEDLGLEVMRFSNLEVLKSIQSVLASIHARVERRLREDGQRRMG